MWKWIIGIIIGLFVIGVIVVAYISISFMADPQGSVDFMMGYMDNVNVNVDGKRVRVEFDELEDSLNKDDRLFVFKKLIVLHMQWEEYGKFYDELKEYEKELLDAADDKTLSVKEYEKLRSMFSDKVSDEDVENWLVNVIKEEKRREGKNRRHPEEREIEKDEE